MTTTATTPTRTAHLANLRANWIMDFVEARIMRRRGDVSATQIAKWEAAGERAWRRHHPHVARVLCGKPTPQPRPDVLAGRS